MSKKAYLIGVLKSHAQSIYETLQILDKPAAEKVDWSEITKLGDQISKQATVAGMLWSGETPDVKQAEENMNAYCNALHGFILICHGSTTGAGLTLHASIRASAKQVVDHSLSLLTRAIHSYDSLNSGERSLIPQLSGAVWEACDALKKVPTTNCVAIGRAITQVAVSIKDVLREMRELKPSVQTDLAVGTGDGAYGSNEDDSSDDGDLSEDLSPEEMGVAQLVITVISDTLLVFKELIRFISMSLRKDLDGEPDYVDSLERLLSYCRDAGVSINDLGACVYPPQEISEMTSIAKKMHLVADNIQMQVGSLSEMSSIAKKMHLVADNIQMQVGSFGGSAEGLLRGIEGLKSSLGKLESSLNGDLVPQMEMLAV